MKRLAPAPDVVTLTGPQGAVVSGDAAEGERPAMENVGIDLHKRESQICVLGEEGTVVREARIKTSRESFEEELGGRPRARILLESSTESSWAAECLERLGHEVIVADPNFAPMYATRNKRVKTDKRDARTLAEACRLGAYRPAHRVSAEQRTVRELIAARALVVKERSALVVLVGAQLRGRGYRVAGGTARCFPERVAELDLDPALRAWLPPLLSTINFLSGRIKELDRALHAATARDPRVKLVKSVPAVGPVIAAAFVARIDDATRFRTARQVQSYVGLVPREYSSGEKQHRGRITKTGDARLRSLLVQAAWQLHRRRWPETEALREWSRRIAARRGSQVAVVALARRLAGILWAMLRDGTEYRPLVLPVQQAA